MKAWFVRSMRNAHIDEMRKISARRPIAGRGMTARPFRSEVPGSSSPLWS